MTNVTNISMNNAPHGPLHAFFECLFLSGVSSFLKKAGLPNCTDVDFEYPEFHPNDDALELYGSYTSGGREMDGLLVINMGLCTTNPTYFLGDLPNNTRHKETLDLGQGMYAMRSHIRSEMMTNIIDQYYKEFAELVKRGVDFDVVTEAITMDVKKD